MAFYNDLALPPSLACLAPILRAADEIELQRPRAAFLCRVRALGIAFVLNHCSNVLGARQFVYAFHRRLVRDCKESKASRVETSDELEIERYFYQYQQQCGTTVHQAGLADRWKTAGVLFDILCGCDEPYKRVAIDSDIIPTAKAIEENGEISTPYSLLIDSSGAYLSFMRLEEVWAAYILLRNTHGLSWPLEFEEGRLKCGGLDILDWLSVIFGFQKENVRTQRQHLVSLLVNSQLKLNPKADPLEHFDDQAVVDDTMSMFFRNYKAWCNLLGQEHSLQWANELLFDVFLLRKMLYLGLHLLITGEAAIFDHFPACLCYIFHNMGHELHSLLSGNTSIVTGENILPLYGGGDGAFQRKVIAPFYRTLEKESRKSQKRNSSQPDWCYCANLNEHFKSSDCLSLSWPINADRISVKSSYHLGQCSTQQSLMSRILRRWRKFQVVPEIVCECLRPISNRGRIGARSHDLCTGISLMIN